MLKFFSVISRQSESRRLSFRHYEPTVQIPVLFLGYLRCLLFKICLHRVSRTVTPARSANSRGQASTSSGSREHRDLEHKATKETKNSITIALGSASIFECGFGADPVPIGCTASNVKTKSQDWPPKAARSAFDPSSLTDDATVSGRPFATRPCHHLGGIPADTSRVPVSSSDSELDPRPGRLGYQHPRNSCIKWLSNIIITPRDGAFRIKPMTRATGSSAHDRPAPRNISD